MSRPATLKIGNTSYWTIMTYTSAGVLVDADSTPTVVVYKNGTLTADVVTVTKRSATTGIYDAYYNPASEAEGDCFTIQETATISSQAYVQSWNFEILAAERGTDNASTFDAASDAVANVTTVASVTNAVTTDAASRTASQADVSALATAASISALNDLSAVQVENAVWEASISSHNSAGSTGKALKQLKEGVISQDGSVDDASATATSFITNLTETVDGFFHDKVIVFVSGDLAGQARHIENYSGTTKTVTVSQAFTSVPADADEFLILATHEHSLGEIADGVWDEPQAGHTTVDTFGYFLDSQVSAAGGGSAPTAQEIVDAWGNQDQSVYVTAGTLGYFLDAQVSGAGAGGSGLYQVTVRVEDSSNNALQGARVNVDGTTLTLATGSSGEVVFNLDSGIYLLNVSPPAGYTTPLGQVVTVTTADLSETFTLVGSGTCSPGWVG
jgi:hypothetical protein